MNLKRILNNLLKHEQLRANSLNMIASENRTSPIVRIMMASDLAHRYSAKLYGGSIHIRRILELCEETLQNLFNAKHVLITPLSGTLAVLSAILGLTRPGELIAKVAGNDGGFPLKLRAHDRFELQLRFDHRTRSIDVDFSKNMLLKKPPAMIMLGQSVFTHPHPVQEFKELIDSRLSGIPLVFDGSHVLGLIAGKQFQDPLSEGADILLGSTHKTFFGPQGGIVLSNSRKIFKKVENFGGFIQGEHVLIDNMHPHRVAALAIASLELLEFGKAYAAQVVKNSQALAHQLHINGLPLKGNAVEFTKSHQVLLDYPPQPAISIKTKLEHLGIFTDILLRLGTSELTRLGMHESEMKYIADIITDCIHDNLQLEKLAKRVKELSERFQTIQYTFDLAEYSSIPNLVKQYFSI
ncbi:MAG: serine hydroxymethyltransferase [Candidatus Helarchaeota archaeon]